MPASMMIAPAGFMLKVSGSSIAIVAGGPSPGRMPTTVPRKTPTKHHSRFAGASATENPCRRLVTTSTLVAEETGRKRHVERPVEHEIEARPGRDGHERRGPERAPVHHRDDEISQQGEADDEAQRVEQRDRNREREPGRERSAHPGPVDRVLAEL